jgi:hypothetical protein
MVSSMSPISLQGINGKQGYYFTANGTDYLIVGMEKAGSIMILHNI